jgi:hypothetical protein
MKQILGLFLLVATPAFLAATVVQSPERTDTTQTTTDGVRSQSGRSTSHDRHPRKHRSANHHHRRHTTAKGGTH